MTTNSKNLFLYLLYSLISFLGGQHLYSQCGSSVKQVGETITFTWQDKKNPQEKTIYGVKNGYQNYILVNVIGGVTYHINSYEIVVCLNGEQLNRDIGLSTYTPKSSGKMRIYYDGWSTNTYLTIRVYDGENKVDDKNSSPSIQNQWRVHYFHSKQTDAPKNSSGTYLGYFDLPESFDIEKKPATQNGGKEPEPFEIYSQNSNDVRARVEPRYFFTRAFMRTTRSGLYYIDVGSDDGTALSIDNKPVYNNWSPSYYTPTVNQIIRLNGNNTIKYEYYNNNVPLRYLFQISDDRKIIENTISGAQILCSNKDSGTPIVGDDFNRKNQRNFTPKFQFQWCYSESEGGKLTDITGATEKDFTPKTNTTPFNKAGTYYLYRKASVTFKNVGMTNETTESVTSNSVRVDVLSGPKVDKIKPYKKSFCRNQNDEHTKIRVEVSAGKPDYTLTYKVNGKTKTYSGAGNVFEVPIETSNAGTFEYEYISITDANGCVTEIGQIDGITIYEPPTAIFSGNNTSLCLKTSRTEIMRANLSGARPFTVKIRATKNGGLPVEVNQKLSMSESNLIISHNPDEIGAFTYEVLSVSDGNGCETFFNDKRVVVNVEEPSITLPSTQEITWCLPAITQATYQSNGSVRISENAYTLTRGSTDLDVTINPVPCCPNPTLKWTINNDLSNVRTGQPSAFTGAISFENSISTDKVYTITYWLECNGQKYNYVTRRVRITPRPQINFSN